MVKILEELSTSSYHSDSSESEELVLSQDIYPPIESTNGKIVKVEEVEIVVPFMTRTASSLSESSFAKDERRDKKMKPNFFFEGAELEALPDEVFYFTVNQ